MLFHQEFGIDLGTDTIKIYDKKTDAFSIEKNLIAVRDGSEVLGVGNEAYKMLGRTAADTVVMTPVLGGRINDIRNTEAVIHLLLFSQKHYIGHKPSIYFAVPTDMTELERRAYAMIARRGRLRNCSVYLVEKPILDALALGLPVRRAKGSLMINAGAVATELSAIAAGHVVLSKSIPVGGRSIDEAIAAAVRKRNKLVIGPGAAEELKIKLAGTQNPPAGMSVSGIDAMTGLPRSGYITVTTVRKAAEDTIKQLLAPLSEFTERIPPQIRNKAVSEGVYLAGGASALVGLDSMLSKKLGFPIHLSSQGGYCTVNGLKEVIGHDSVKKIAYEPLSDKREVR